MGPSTLSDYIYCIYLFEHNKLSLEEFLIIENYYKENIYKYDFIFFIESRSLAIKDNGYRALDKTYQEDIFNIFNALICTKNRW